MREIRKTFVLSALAGALVLGGCATNSAVDQRIADLEARTDQKLESVATQVEDLQEKQRETDQKIDEVSREAQDALRRAEEAGVLARGRVVFEQAFSDDTIRFSLGSSELQEGGLAALDQLATRIRELNHPVFIEVQGHTDATGATGFNEDLGFARAESVRRYLSQQHNIPLVRMSTISYGESMPVADNSTRDGRTANRRVVIVVLE